MRNWFILIALSSIISISCEKSGQVNVVAVKAPSTNHIVQNIPFQVVYTIFNLGEQNISRVVLKEDTFDSEVFAIPEETTFHWEAIPPNFNVTISLTLVPKVGNIAFNFSSALVTYTVGSEADVRVSKTSFLGLMRVMSIDEHMRKHSSHLFYWLISALVITPCIMFPYVQWYNTKYLYRAKKAIKSKNE